MKKERERAHRHLALHKPLSELTKTKEQTDTCEGLNLSLPGEIISNKPLHGLKREIKVLL